VERRGAEGAREGTLGSMDPVEALHRLGGIAGIGEWRALTSRAAARDALDDGRVLRLKRHQVALPGSDLARRRAAELGGTVSHLSAAQWWGWKLKTVPPSPTITVPRGARGGAAPGSVELHWGHLQPDEAERGVTSPVRTVVDCSRAYPFDVALCVADSALRSRLVHPDDLLTAARRSPRTGRARAVRVAEAASGLADNPFESVLRAIAIEVPGLRPRPQAWIGQAGRVDLVDDALMIVMEADSWEHHGNRDAFKHDVRRYAEFASRGWVVVRFLWEDVMRDPERVRRTLTAVVAVRRRQLTPPTSAVQRSA
jgi:very-short-patch-repair endonuclease